MGEAAKDRPIEGATARLWLRALGSPPSPPQTPDRDESVSCAKLE
jgi:hypothetical protein